MRTERVALYARVSTLGAQSPNQAQLRYCLCPLLFAPASRRVAFPGAKKCAFSAVSA